MVRVSVAGFAAASLLMLALFLIGLGSFWLLVFMLIVANAFLGLVIPTAMVLSLEEHGEIAGSAAALGGTLQMLVGAVAIAIVSLVFDGTPLPVVASIAGCGVIALTLSFLTLGRRTA